MESLYILFGEASLEKEMQVHISISHTLIIFLLHLFFSIVSFIIIYYLILLHFFFSSCNHAYLTEIGKMVKQT